MAFKFQRSHTVLLKLAEQTARTPPAEDESPPEYTDRGFAILGRKFDTIDQKLRDEFLSQRTFITSQFGDTNRKIDSIDRKIDGLDERMDGLEKRMDGLHQRMDGLVRRMDGFDKRMDGMDKKIDILQEHLENTEAVTRNSKLRRLHQPIRHIKVRTSTGWAVPSQFPKHIMALFQLGQQAKGEGYGRNGRQATMQKAQDTMRQLLEFYGITVWSDEQSESEGTEVALDENTVDAYMEELLDLWGMDWQKICRMGVEHTQPQPQHAGVIRAGGAVNNEGKKKARPGL